VNLSAGVALDHGLLQKNYEGVHLWLVRRWSAVSIGATSTVGLLLSLLLARFNPVMSISLQREWCVPVIVLAVMLATVAIFAWCDTMKMLTFMIQTTGWWHQEHVRQRAYELWDSARRPEGKDVEHWLQAEAEIARECGSRWRNPPVKD
jgi:hypothetical protein